MLIRRCFKNLKRKDVNVPVLGYEGEDEEEDEEGYGDEYDEEYDDEEDEGGNIDSN